MVRIIAGMDMSGSAKIGHNAFLAVVIGLDEHIRSAIDATGYERIHMRGMRKRDQNRVVSRLKLSNTECVILCVKIDKVYIIEKIIHALKTKNRPVIRRQIFHAYHRLVLEEIRDQLDGFLSRHGSSLSDVVFECDSDCIGFAKDARLRYRYVKPYSKVEVHMLADIIAWLNTNKIELKNVIVMDRSDKILGRLKKDFMK